MQAFDWTIPDVFPFRNISPVYAKVIGDRYVELFF